MQRQGERAISTQKGELTVQTVTQPPIIKYDSFFKDKQVAISSGWMSGEKPRLQKEMHGSKRETVMQDVA